MGGLLGGVAGGVLLGGIYAVLLRRRPLARRPTGTLLVAVAIGWVGGMAALWPVLPASYLGLGPAPAAAVTALGFLLQFGVYGAALRLVLRWTDPQPAAGVEIDESRRRLMLGAVAGVFAIGTAAMATILYKNSALGYDWRTSDGPAQPQTPNSC